MRLLDVGCSSGAFLHTAREMRVRGVGVEPCIEAATAARDAGLEVHHGVLEEIPFAVDSFDVITLFEVVEHVREPLSLLCACHRLLRPGGVVFLKTANTSSWTVCLRKGRWHYFDVRKHGGHVSFFNPRSVTLLARRSGLEPLEIVTRSVEFFEPGEDRPWIVRSFLKILTELAQLPARLSGNGQELFVFLGKK
ncbi:MAG: class I SAM-dependent methyltransferase [Thermodesulfobacteriota bacterium]